METTGPRQRIAITYGRAEEAKYVTHLDLMRLWERLLRRARLPVSYSAAQTPRPRFSLAAPLAVGATSEGEMLDVYLDSRLPIPQLSKRLALECPVGFSVVQVHEMGLNLPSLQSMVRLGEYRVAVDMGLSVLEAQRLVDSLLAAGSLPRQRRREKEVRSYDLRPQIEDLWIAEWGSTGGILGMLLQTDEHATGRPDEVLAALGVGETARSIHRVKLILAEPTRPETPSVSWPQER